MPPTCMRARFSPRDSASGRARALELSRRPGAPGGALHDLALLLDEDRFHAEALVLEMEALEREPNDPVLLRQAAAFWKANERLDQAFRMLDRLARSGEADAEDHFQLGLMGHRLGDPVRALEAYGDCLRLDPEHPEACYNRALLLRERGDADASIASFERVLALRPRYEPTYFELGAYLIDLGRTREAQSVYERYLAAGSDSVALAEAGTILEQLRTGGNPWADPAADSLRRALGFGR
ncbi:MAG: tetratricopeptide repeat protein [Candidatus Eisenbacteria bacterium]|nr:tetratricopeptide repeat protein [Candidatus Eisenbacteria bacterium]